MRDYDQETAFLRRMLSYDESSESRRVDQAIERTQRDHACALKAVWTVGLLALLSAVLSQVEFFQSAPAIRLRIVCVAAMAAVICLLAFVTVLIFYRLRLNGLREDSRRLIGELIESRTKDDLSPSATFSSSRSSATASAPHPTNGI